MTSLQVHTVRCEYRENPIGIDHQKPRFSWQLASDRRGTLQAAYRIQVADDDANFDKPLWDTGRIESDQSIQVAYAGPPLASRSRYHVRIQVWDTFGRESDWSPLTWFETAFLCREEWKAEWITPDPESLDPAADPAFLMRKEFAVTKRVVRARVYATALGVYELFVNGSRVGDDWLSPGWTSYNHRLQYQTYDVTQLIQDGTNTLGVVLANGWYKGELTWDLKKDHYGSQRAALVQLHVQYDDGTEDMILSDSSWKASTGAILYSEIYHGETYDARLEQTGWSTAGFLDAGWASTVPYHHTFDPLVAQETEPVRVTETIRPIAVLVTPAGDTVLDMGQNMVGRVRFSVEAPSGTRIVLQHAEVLDHEGNFYTANLRRAKQQVEYIAKGDGLETYAPHFTFQGFRYVKVEGVPGQENGLRLDRFIGEVMHTDMTPTGEFECSNEMVNQLQRNITWGQRGNFVDVPTDCPQRDERLGWTGDAQVFVRTALFNFQGGPFFTKWLRDLRVDQAADGGVPPVIPDVVHDLMSSAAWGDAAVICPWTVYLCYGDERLLAEQYGSMKAWVEYIRAQGDHEFLWNTGFHFGDWLGLDAKEGSAVGATPKDLIATAYYAYSAQIVADAARVLGHEADAKTYAELHRRVVQAFQDEFITPNGRVAAATQTAHVLVLAFDLALAAHRSRIAHDLNQLIVENDNHLTTGFVGTPYLCFVLSRSGYHDTATKLLLLEEYPGWLYSVSKGATTIWEHWDGIKPDGSFWSDGMNSFNHYAYGAVGDWMYRVVAGLDMDESAPGYKRLRIAPMVGNGELTYARAQHDSMYGRIASGWRLLGDGVEVTVLVPPNAIAEVTLPGASPDGLREGGVGIEGAEGIGSVQYDGSGTHLRVGSGSYRFEYSISVQK